MISYTEYDSLCLDITESQNIRMYWQLPNLNFNWKSTYRAKEKYDSLCKLINDTNYYRKTSYIAFPSERNYAQNKIVSINVHSDQQFDSSHPAFSNLNDVVSFVSFSPLEFIKSNYKESFDWTNNVPIEIQNEIELSTYYKSNVEFAKTNFPVLIYLNDFDPNKMILIGKGVNGSSIGYLHLYKKSTFNFPQKITIEIKLSDGRVMSNSIIVKL
ncbi:MAG: hypothetical protein ACE5RH_02460 [Nitrosarchaeum sp.]